MTRMGPYKFGGPGRPPHPQGHHCRDSFYTVDAQSQLLQQSLQARMRFVTPVQASAGQHVRGCPLAMSLPPRHYSLLKKKLHIVLCLSSPWSRRRNWAAAPYKTLAVCCACQCHGAQSGRPPVSPWNSHDAWAWLLCSPDSRQGRAGQRRMWQAGSTSTGGGGGGGSGATKC
jgi:hypothetical protein